MNGFERFISGKKQKGGKIAKPRVLIPILPGTNAEDEAAAAFAKAGAEVETLVIRNLTPADFNESVKKLAEAIKKSQIIALPGGFSAYDEPNGSGRLTAAAFNSPGVTEALLELLQKRDGLMLGICGGFATLLALGLIPYGENRMRDETGPVLAFNTVGRHISAVCRTRVVSDKSPWLYGAAMRETYLAPLSTGEGRLILTEKQFKDLALNGQIATQYVDFDGNASMDARHNPCGAMFAVEGLTSPCGRIFGKVCHSERVGNGLYINVPGSYDMKIFESGVEYFS